MVRKTKKSKYGICKLNKKGYYYISSSPTKRFVGKPLHTVVYEEKHKCTVLWELGGIIHHKNHNKTDNRWYNLELMSNTEHTRLHHTKNDDWILNDFHGKWDSKKQKYIFERIIYGEYYYLEHHDSKILDKKLELLKWFILKRLNKEQISNNVE